MVELNNIKVQINSAYQHTLRHAGIPQTRCVLARMQGHLLPQQQPAQPSPGPLNASIIHQHSHHHWDRLHVCYYHHLEPS